MDMPLVSWKGSGRSRLWPAPPPPWMHVSGQRTCCQFCLGQENLARTKKTTRCFEIYQIWWSSHIANSNRHLPLTLTDDKDLCRLIPGRLRLSSLHLLEELLEDPEQWLVVFGAEDLGDKGATFGQKVTGQLESHEGQMCWKGEKCISSQITTEISVQLAELKESLTFCDTNLVRRHHVASWHLHLELRRLTQHLPSRFVALSLKPEQQQQQQMNIHKELCWKLLLRWFK